MPNVTQNCPNCGESITRRLKNGYRHIFCGPECYHAYMKKQEQARDSAKPERLKARKWDGIMIRITELLPVFAEFQPAVGAVYSSEKYQYRSERPGYVVTVNGHRVNVRWNESMEV